MKAIYVTRRNFKSLGKLYVVGQVIPAPSLIKRFKNKLAERKIIVLRKDDNFASTVEYLEARSGMPLKEKFEALLSDSPQLEPKEKVPAAKPVATKPVSAVKPLSK